MGWDLAAGEYSTVQSKCDYKSKYNYTMQLSSYRFSLPFSITSPSYMSLRVLPIVRHSHAWGHRCRSASSSTLWMPEERSSATQRLSPLTDARFALPHVYYWLLSIYKHTRRSKNLHSFLSKTRQQHPEYVNIHRAQYNIPPYNSFGFFQSSLTDGTSQIDDLLRAASRYKLTLWTLLVLLDFQPL